MNKEKLKIKEEHKNDPLWCHIKKSSKAAELHDLRTQLQYFINQEIVALTELQEAQIRVEEVQGYQDFIRNKIEELEKQNT